MKVKSVKVYVEHCVKVKSVCGTLSEVKSEGVCGTLSESKV